MSVPYVTVSPGPTVDVLGEDGDEPIVEVDGHRTYPTDGQLRLTTVSVTNPDAHVDAARGAAGVDGSDEDVLPFEAMYPRTAPPSRSARESARRRWSARRTPRSRRH